LNFSPDGRYLAVCGNELVGRIWDMASAEICQILRGHTASIYTIRYSPNGRYLVTACQDGTVRVWDAENGAELLNYRSPTECRFRTAFFTPDSRRVVAGSSDGYYRLLAFADFDELLDIVRKRITRDWKLEERRRYLREEFN
jgi:WD40 repeat protein